MKTTETNCELNLLAHAMAPPPQAPVATSKRAESAKSSSSNEFIDRQLNEMLINNENESLSSVPNCQLQRGRRQSSQDTGGGEAIDMDTDDDALENVAVMVRCRPLQVGASEGGNSSTAAAAAAAAVVQVDESNKCIQVDERQFYFDQVFSPSCDNEQVYMRSARRLVECAFRGYNCTIFLYGQTGTGKTFTHSSLTLGSFEHLFSLIQDSSKSMRFLIRASYYELYNEEIRDLLAPPSATSGSRRPRDTKRDGRGGSGSGGGGGGGGGGSLKPKSLELRESKERGVYVKDLTCFLVNNLNELNKLKKLGDQRRTTGSTQMNEHSSRAHSIFAITIETIDSSNNGVEQQVGAAGTQKKPANRGNSNSKSKEQPVIRVGHLSLIDLAGSERQSKSGSSGLRMKEASQINLSLTCLSLVIRALTDSGDGSQATRHVPYRNSKLTRLLSSSLGGNSKTILIACISAARSNLDETLNTLRFASRTKQIKNKAVINEDPKDALLRKYRRQLNELRQKLSEQQQQQLKQSQSSRDHQNDVTDGVNKDAASDDDDSAKQIRLNKQLEMLKAKIMFGGENLLDKLELHERLIEASKAELEERRREEAKLRNELLNKKQTIEQVVQSKGSLESQLEYLDSKLNRAIGLYKSSKLELKDSASEHELLKEQLLQAIKSTSKEIKHVDCILEDFIPRKHLDLINAYAQFDDESDQWQIKYIALSGNNIAQTKRLVGSSLQVAPISSEQSRNELASAAPRAVGKKSRVLTATSDISNNNRPDPFIRL